MSLTLSATMNIKILCEWNGNFAQAIQIISEHNTEVSIRTSNKKLIIKDRNVDFYICVRIGDEIEVPVYDGSIYVDEIHIPDPEPIKEKICPILYEQMRKEWGL